MKATLSPSWELSDDHAMNSHGQPVLVQRSTGDAYGPGDILQPYNSSGFMPAAQAVARLAKTQTLDAEAQALVDRFTSCFPVR